MSDDTPSAVYVILRDPHKNPMRQVLLFPHLLGKETESQRHWVKLEEAMLKIQSLSLTPEPVILNV